MKVAIAGGPDVKDTDLVFKTLDFWCLRLPISALIVGGQVTVDPSDKSKMWGIDHIAGRWAEARGVPLIVEGVADEDWKKLGKGAQAIRNRRALDRHEPKRVIAFAGGQETADLLDMARQRGVKCIEVASS